jgi:hypothetical protein
MVPCFMQLATTAPTLLLLLLMLLLLLLMLMPRPIGDTHPPPSLPIILANGPSATRPPRPRTSFHSHWHAANSRTHPVT